MTKGKRGQSANRVGTIIILITVILVLYLLFLPPQTRDELLFDDTTPGDDFNDSSVRERLLDVEPGDLTYVDRERRRYSIPAYSVSSEVQGVELQRRDSIRIYKSLFNEQSTTMQFTTTPSLTDNVLLSFNVENANGVITIDLNGETLYTDRVTGGSVPPISIDSDLLQSSNNLTFTVNPPGMAFWSTNEYELSNARVTADVRDTSQNENYQTVYIPEDDYERVERVEAEYIATCTERNVEGFELSINNFLLFEGTPDCALATQKSFDPGALQPGQNDLLTEIDEGNVLIDRFTLTTYFGDTEEKTYYFDLDDDYFTGGDDPVLDDIQANATFTFADDDEKQFNFFVNGRRMSITTRNSELSRNITGDVKPGNNVVRIEPRNDFTMSQLTVDLVKTS
jgi:hypothetical protein